MEPRNSSPAESVLGLGQVLDYYHCSERIHRVATAIYGEGLKGQEWAEATLTRLYHGEEGQVIGGLKRMRERSAQADHEIIKLMDYLHEHRHRTTYERLCRGGYPLGSEGIESLSLSTRPINHGRHSSESGQVQWAKYPNILGGGIARSEMVHDFIGR